MSGFLPDIASWALGGGGGNAAGGGDGASNNNNNNDENEDNTNNETNNNEQDLVAEEPTADEMRAKRMARLAALEQNKSDDGNGGASGAKNAADATTPMDIDKPSPSVSAPAPSPMEIDNNEKPKPTPTSTNDTIKDVTMEPAPKKKIKGVTSPADPLVKLRRRKVLLLRRVLLVTVGDNASDRDPKCVHLSLDDDDIYNVTKNPSGIQVCHIAELLAARLSLSPSSRSLETMPPQTNLGLIGYLGGCHKRAGEEMKELKHGGGSSKKKDDPISNEELFEILDEIRSQV